MRGSERARADLGTQRLGGLSTHRSTSDFPANISSCGGAFDGFGCRRYRRSLFAANPGRGRRRRWAAARAGQVDHPALGLRVVEHRLRRECLPHRRRLGHHRQGRGERQWGAPTAIAGLGDEAWTASGNNGSLVYARKGSNGFLLIIDGPQIDSLSDHGVAQEKTLAAAILGRL